MKKERKAMETICAILGTDEGKVAEEALKKFNALKPEGSDDFGNDLIEGKADNTDHASEIISNTLQALQTLPFFGGKVVWLKDASFLGDDRTGSSERTKEGVESLLKVLKGGLAPGISFLISASGIDKRRAFYKYLKKEANCSIFDKIDVSKDGWEDTVARLVMSKSKPLGMTFADEALDLFVQQAGEDTRQIINELEKLSLYLIPETHVTIEAVRTMIPLNRKGVIWEISRCIERGDGARAIHLVDAQLEKGEQAVGLLRAAIIPTVRNTFFAKLAMVGAGVQRADKRGFSSLLRKVNSVTTNALPKKADGNVNSWAIANGASAASRMTLKKLRASLESCLKADRALVTTAADHHMVLHRLIIEVTS